MIGTADIVKALRSMGYDASHRPPAGKNTFVTVEMIAGGFHDKVASPSFAIQFWDVSEPAAEKAALRFVRGFYSTSMSAYSRLGNLVCFPDMQANKSRYQIELITTSTL